MQHCAAHAREGSSDGAFTYGRGKAKGVLAAFYSIVEKTRDIVFDRRKAPSSIVLTTLLAQSYEGHALCSDALITALDRIAAELEARGMRL